MWRLVNVLIEEIASVEMSEAVTMVPPPGPAALGLYCCWFIGVLSCLFESRPCLNCGSKDLIDGQIW